MKRIAALTISLLMLFLSGCAENPDATNPAPFGDDIPAGTSAPAEQSPQSGAQTPDFESTDGSAGSSPEWKIYADARDATEALDNRECQIMVYTRIKSGAETTTQSLNILVKFIGAHSAAPQIGAVGSVKAKDRVIDLEMYYRDSVLYSASGDSRSRQDTYFDAAAAEIDVLRVFRKELTSDYITSISCEDSLDGTKQISMRFKGLINGLMTEGSGEIVVGASGLITSEGYTFDSVRDGQSVSQSAEVTLTGYGDQVTPIEFPDLDKY